MSMSSPYLIVLTGAEDRVLAARVASGRTEYRDRVRAQIVVEAAHGGSNAGIAEALQIGVDAVRRWRRRFATATGERVEALTDRPRSGRPPVHGPAVRAEAVALACALPAENDVPLSRWSCPEIARELAARCQVSVSVSSVQRWLADDALKPWRHQSWISIRDPEFAVEAARVLDLYAGIWDGKPLGPNDYVICADERTSIQARCRCHPTLPPGRARMMRVEHDYQRKGALAYLAAWDVHRGQVIGRCEDTTGIEPFSRLVEHVMTQEPYASADRVFWITDNGSSHRGARSVQRMRRAWPTAHLIHTPVHASWLDQCEIYFSVVQRKVVAPNDFFDLDQIRARLAAFEIRYNAVATPFNGKFTQHDLEDLLRRIDAHEHPTQRSRTGRLITPAEPTGATTKETFSAADEQSSCRPMRHSRSAVSGRASSCRRTPEAKCPGAPARRAGVAGTPQ
jgi:transposase